MRPPRRALGWAQIELGCPAAEGVGRKPTCIPVSIGTYLELPCGTAEEMEAQSHNKSFLHRLTQHVAQVIQQIFTEHLLFASYYLGAGHTTGQTHGLLELQSWSSRS